MHSTMRAAHLKGYQNFEMVEVDIPQINDDQVLVHVDKVGICGSDIGMWNEHHFFNELFSWDEFEPGDHGHESVGTVVETGRNVDWVTKGDQVVRLNLLDSFDLKMANFAEYAVSDCCIRCNGADPEVMCFTDPVMVALNHIHAADVTPGDTVIVMGQGLLGLIVTQLLVDNHVNVIAADISDRRLKLAADFGAEPVNAAKVDLADKIKQSGADVRAIIECSGADEAINTACHVLGRGGTLVIMGATRTQITFSYTQMRIKGAAIKFPMNRVNHKDNWLTAAQLLMDGAVEVKSLIDKRDKLENLQTILENYDNNWLRVVLEV